VKKVRNGTLSEDQKLGKTSNPTRALFSFVHFGKIVIFTKLCKFFLTDQLPHKASGVCTCRLLPNAGLG
jgi:hypothetical protein